MTAIQEFNAVFDRTIDDRPNPDLQSAMIEFANARGRHDIARRLREQFDAQRVSASRER
jgi:hypothetical protein